jgi:hypothetical protein
MKMNSKNYQNLGDTAKSPLRTKFITINVYIIKQTSQINNLVTYLKLLKR